MIRVHKKYANRILLLLGLTVLISCGNVANTVTKRLADMEVSYSNIIVRKGEVVDNSSSPSWDVLGSEIDYSIAPVEGGTTPDAITIDEGGVVAVDTANVIYFSSYVVTAVAKDTSTAYSGSKEAILTIEVSTEYYLYSPMGSKETYLIDEADQLVHTWVSDYGLGTIAYLRDDGMLVRLEKPETNDNLLQAPGNSGRVAVYDKEGKAIWEYTYADEAKILHHDMALMPNGNMLFLAWEKYTLTAAVNRGLDKSKFWGEEEIWPDHVIEVDSAKNIVWEWHVWDHLIQEHDESKENYGSVKDNPGKININYIDTMKPHEDWTHANSIAYNEQLDQILLSIRCFSEIWIIDHGTTTEEARGEKGDLLYRWGNPAAVGQVNSAERTLFYQHDARWITESRILLFNNGDRKKREYSSVLEIEYRINTNTALGETKIIWEYKADPPEDFFAPFMSGAQRLENGNTLITQGREGSFFVVTLDKRTVKTFTNTFPLDNSSGNSVFRFRQYSGNTAAMRSLLGTD